MIKAVIVDDEKKARDFIESIVKNNFPDIKVVEKAASVVEGIKAITRNRPDIVFLDIEMNDGNGFDVLEALPERDFDFIFITAYDQYAIKAFKYSAVDYLVKPIEISEFISAVERILENRKKPANRIDNFNILKENFETKSPSKLVVSSNKGFEYINIEEIIRFEADGRYTNIYLINNQKITVSKMLREFVDIVDERNFYRTHKSHLINLQHVTMFAKTEGGHIIMDDDSKVAVARDKRDEFLNIMKEFSS
ncbi:LytR/AlgR family response regulator transcription factor [Bacteroidota bacterium]